MVLVPTLIAPQMGRFGGQSPPSLHTAPPIHPNPDSNGESKSESEGESKNKNKGESRRKRSMASSVTSLGCQIYLGIYV